MQETWRLIPKFLLTRTTLCKHKHACVDNVLSSFFHTFLNGLAIKVLVSNITYITNVSKLLKNLASWTQSKDNLRFALFFALMNTVYKFVLCMLRRVTNSDKFNALIAGFIAGLMSRIDVQRRRSFLLILLLSRFCDLSFTMAENLGAVSRVKNGELFVWVLCSVFQQYGFGIEQNIVNQGQLHFMLKWSLMLPKEGTNAIKYCEALNQRVQDTIASRQLARLLNSCKDTKI